MSDKRIKLGVVAPKVPGFRNAEAESYVVGSMYRGGIDAEMTWYRATTEFPEAFKKFAGIIAVSLSERNYDEWSETDIKVPGATGGWDRVVTNAVHYASQLSIPVFTTKPFEEIGYYEFVGSELTSFDERFDNTPHEGWMDGAEYVTIERGAWGSKAVNARLQSA